MITGKSYADGGRAGTNPKEGTKDFERLHIEPEERVANPQEGLGTQEEKEGCRSPKQGFVAKRSVSTGGNGSFPRDQSIGPQPWAHKNVSNLRKRFHPEERFPCTQTYENRFLTLNEEGFPTKQSFLPETKEAFFKRWYIYIHVYTRFLSRSRK